MLGPSLLENGPSIQILHWKSVIFDVVLTFFNKPLCEGGSIDNNINMFKGPVIIYAFGGRVKSGGRRRKNFEV